MSREILLISSSMLAGQPVLSHAREEICSILGERKTVTFVPYASPRGISYEEYAEGLRPVFASMGYSLVLISETNPIKDVQEAEAIFVGGGNTWHLLKTLKDRSLLRPIRERVYEGMPYIGSSAGTNVAGISIGNTNDMPAAECYGREALALVPFNINTHYQDSLSLSKEERVEVLKVAPQLKILLDHQGETRDVRLKEYHALGNREKIVALRESSMLSISSRCVVARGLTGAKIFSPEGAVIEYVEGSVLPLFSPVKVSQ